MKIILYLLSHMMITRSDTSTVTEFLQAIIANLYPDSLIDNEGLVVANDKFINNGQILNNGLPSKISWHHETFDHFNQQKFFKKYELALIVLTPDDDLSANKNEANGIIQSIQRCRDLFARHTLVILPQHDNVNLTELGFNRLIDEPIYLNEITCQIWQFNLFDYKQLPDWLNNRFWANPENWNKFRW